MSIGRKVKTCKSGDFSNSVGTADSLENAPLTLEGLRMKIIIVGAGEVGESIARDLSDTHEIVIIEKDPERVEELTYDLDVLSIAGNGATTATLEEAGVTDADIVIASTDNDEVNIVVCSTVKALSDAFTIARVKQTEYLRTWQRASHAFGTDFMVCTNLLAAESIVRLIGLTGAHDVSPFAGGEVEMAEFTIEATSPVAEQTVREADRYDALTFAAVLRNGTVEIPTGETRIGAGDRVVVIGTPRSVAAFANYTTSNEDKGEASDIVIIGGSEIGYNIAESLEDRGRSSRLVEQDAQRARQLAEDLPETVVLESDGTDMEFLERENIGSADVLVAALDADEKNLVACLLATRLGVDRTMAVINTAEYVELFEAVGIDVGIHPRQVVAEEISRFTRERGAENIAFIGDGDAEVLEIEIDEESVLADRPIRDSIRMLPQEVVIGAITRHGEFVVPRGETTIQPGDHIVLFVETGLTEDVMSSL